MWRNKVRLGKNTAIQWNASLDTSKGGAITLGSRCRIRHGSVLASAGGHIEIGDDCSVNHYSILSGSGGLNIGNNVRIGPHCVIVSENHNFSRRDVPIAAQGMVRKGIVIKNDVWVGANVTILDGSVIETGCVLAAGAVVRGHTQPFGVYAGVPARRIKERP